MTRRALLALRGLVPLAVLIAGWQAFGNPYSPYFPVPSQWWNALTATGTGGGTLWRALGLTVEDFLISLVLAVVIGALLGVAIGASDRADASLNPLFQFLRAIPAAAIVPAATLVLGAGTGTAVAIVVFACVWPVIIATSSATRQLNPLLLDVSHTLRLSRAARIRKLLFPSLYSAILIGARVTAPLALLITILVELLMGNSGIGGLLGTAQQEFQSAAVFGYVAVSAVLALIVNAGLVGLGAYASRYSPDHASH